MKITCPTCQAKYKLADDKVLGRTVKIRCKGCAETFVVCGDVNQSDGPAPQSIAPSEVDGARLGERNEGSVLFSLAALTSRAQPLDFGPKPASPLHDDSGLVDIRADIAQMGGGVFSAPLAPPVLLAVAQPEPKSNGLRVWIASGFFALTCAVVLSTLYVGRSREAPREVARNVVAAVTAVLPNATEPSVATVSPVPSDVPTSAPSSPVVREHTTPRPVVSATTTQAPIAKCCAGETDAACAMRRSVGAACSDTSPPFDRAAAARVLSSVDLSQCKRPNGDLGSGHVTVTFEPSGTASAANVDTSAFAGTTAGRCIAQSYRGAKVPAFSGSAITVGKTFTLN